MLKRVANVVSVILPCFTQAVKFRTVHHHLIFFQFFITRRDLTLTHEASEGSVTPDAAPLLLDLQVSHGWSDK